MPYVVNFLNGAGGHGYWLRNAQLTADLYNGLHPSMVNASMLTVVPGTPLYRAVQISYGGRCERIGRVYLVGADPFALPAARLVERIELIRRYLPNAETFTMYARTDNVARKSDEDLAALKDVGVRGNAARQRHPLRCVRASAREGRTDGLVNATVQMRIGFEQHASFVRIAVLTTRMHRLPATSTIALRGHYPSPATKQAVERRWHSPRNARAIRHRRAAASSHGGNSSSPPWKRGEALPRCNGTGWSSAKSPNAVTYRFLSLFSNIRRFPVFCLTCCHFFRIADDFCSGRRAFSKRAAL